MKDLHIAKKGIVPRLPLRNLQRQRLAQRIAQAQLVAVEVMAGGNSPVQLQPATIVGLCPDGVLLRWRQCKSLFSTQNRGLRSGSASAQAGRAQRL